MILGVTHPQSVLQCGIMIQNYRKTGKDVTPEFCHKILTSSSNSGIASKLINLISTALSSETNNIDRYLPYIETILGREETTAKVVERTIQMVNANFPLDNYTHEEYIFAQKLQSYDRHTEISQAIAQRLWERVQIKYIDKGIESYTIGNPRINIDMGIYDAYPQRLAPDIIKLLQDCEKIKKADSGTITRADISLIVKMVDLYEAYASENFKQNPEEVMDIIQGLSQASARLNIPMQKDMCAGSLKRILRTLSNVQSSETQPRRAKENLLLLLLDAQGIRPANGDFPNLAQNSSRLYEDNWKQICESRLVELFLPKLLEQKINVQEKLKSIEYKGTAELLNISLSELALRCNTTEEADWLLHDCFAFSVTRETVFHWLRYPEISGNKLYEDYKSALKEGNVTIDELAQAVNRGAQANFRLIKKANGEPFVAKPRTDLRDKSLEALLNVYCEAYNQKAEPPEDVYKTIYDVRFGKIGHLVQDPRKPLELFRMAVSKLAYKKLPPELSKLTKTSYGYNRLLLKKPFTK